MEPALTKVDLVAVIALDGSYPAVPSPVVLTWCMQACDRYAIDDLDAVRPISGEDLTPPLR